MLQNPKIETISEINLIGKRITMSFSNIQTPSLWKSFMPRRKEIKNTIGTEFYSVEIYKDLTHFQHFNPEKSFEKWAAVQVSNIEEIPSEMDSLIIPKGKYAVFNHRGKGSQASKVYRYILEDWLPNSEFALDNRPHFAVMGEKYKNEDPESEEELWFP